MIETLNPENPSMHATPTILQIIFYIAAMLAPEGSTSMTLSQDRGDAKQFAKTAAGTWRLAADASEWKTTIDSVIIQPRKAGSKDQRQKLAANIDKTPNLPKKLRTHDWTAKTTLRLSGGLIIDKTDDGFRIHAPKQEDTPVVDFRVVYSK
jgi:hypothetical protein